MKKLISLILIAVVYFSLSPASYAQVGSCDTCTAPWSPVQDIVITGQTMPQKKSTCLYTFIYKIRTRMCNGELQVDMVDLMARLESGCNTFCCLNQPQDCYYTTQSAKRALANMLGPIVMSRETSCYMMFEVDPPAAFKNCFLSPGETQDHWYDFISCDTNACCIIRLTPLGGGPVQSDEVLSMPCTPGAAPNLPSFVTWECNGVTYNIPVIPGQTPSCEATCNSGSSVLYKTLGGENTSTSDKLENISVYPNPATGAVTVDYHTSKTGPYDLKIYSMQGVLVKIVSLKYQSDKVSIPVSELATGQYICHIYANETKILSQNFSVID